MLAVRLPEEIEKRLDDLARRTGRTRTFYAREAILEHLKDLEDTYGAERTGSRLRDPSIPPARTGLPPGSPLFTSRWQGKFRPAAKADERYRSLAKKYL